jgi:glyoxylase-like metal-dependent hydrolase (beta-lactamase superfamily II)
MSMAVSTERRVLTLEIPTPFAVGPVNLFLIDDDPLTLVDTGPNQATALADIASALAKVGRSLNEVGRIVVTHQHLDHAGLVGPLAAVSGAEVCAIAGLDAWLSDGPGGNLGDERFALEVLRGHGAPEQLGILYEGARRGLEGFASSHAEVRALVDGGDLDFAGGALRVHHRPGHSPFDTILEDREAGVLIAGDAIFAKHPAPILPSPPGVGMPADDPACSGLFAAARRTLTWLAASDAEVALVGHGEPVGDPGRVARERLREGEQRAERVLAELTGAGATTAWELTRRLHPRWSLRQPFHALCPTLECLDLLREGGVVFEEEHDGVRWFACA